MDKLKKKTFQPSSWSRSATPTSHPDFPSSSGRSSSQATYPSSSKQHPYSGHQPDVLPIVSSGSSSDDEANCPVCLESLSFSFKLPGEKPHIIPECGHALHEACFTAVYGPVNRGGIRQTSLGLCGVCRRPMKISDGDHSKGNSKPNVYSHFLRFLTIGVPQSSLHSPESAVPRRAQSILGERKAVLALLPTPDSTNRRQHPMTPLRTIHWTIPGP